MREANILASYSTGKRLRTCEWALLSFFLYIAAISPAFHFRSQVTAEPFLILAGVAAALFGLAYAEERGPRQAISFARDWMTLALVLVAYREMDWFTPRQFDHHLENVWIVWDRTLLHALGVQRMIEWTGAWIPSLLEICYLLVYAVGPFTVAMVYVHRRREWIGWILFLYVLGTVAAYGLFPYFPSSPPRSVFPGQDLPGVTTFLRRLNLFLVGGYGIHSSVFPSAHVSSAYSAAWAVLMFIPERRWLGWGMTVYATLVAVATVYGRYHFTVDALAGLGISLAAAVTVRVLHARHANIT
jgi:membrane-associated phospholipid phosphatase